MDLFRNLCRCCNTEQKQLVNIFEQDLKGLTTSIPSMLEYCTSEPLVKDDLKYPPSICYACIKQLEICYRFLKRFHLAQNEFDAVYMQEVRRRRRSLVENYEDEKKVAESRQMLTGISHSAGDKQIATGEPNIPTVQYTDPQHSSYRLDLANEQDVVNIIKPKSETTASPPALLCCICHKTFYTTKALNLHLKLYHKQKTAI